MRKYNLARLCRIRPRCPSLAVRIHRGGLQRVLAPEEKIRGDLMERPVQTQLRKENPVRVGVVAEEAGAPQHVCPDEAENWLADMVHPNEITKTVSAMGRVHPQSYFEHRKRFPLRIDIPRLRIAEDHGRLTFKHLNTSFQV